MMTAVETPKMMKVKIIDTSENDQFVSNLIDSEDESTCNIRGILDC
jgi:hypothetical protein